MAIATDVDKALLVAHLTMARAESGKLRGELPACPVCLCQEWQFEIVGAYPVPLGELPAHPPVPGVAMGAIYYPVAVVTCDRCFYVLSFAWRHVVNKAGK